MGAFHPIKTALIFYLFLGVGACSAGFEPAQTQVSVNPMSDVVPAIDYPDVYVAGLSFGFDLPEDWDGRWEPDSETFVFTYQEYQLTISTLRPITVLRQMLQRLGEPAGYVHIQGFWNSARMRKFHLMEDDDVAVVVYFSEQPLLDRWLTATLECRADDSDCPIQAEIELAADRILASYEEHGWEE